MRNPAHTRSVGYLVLAALLWSTAGVLIKEVNAHPLAIGGGRAMVAALFLMLVCRPLRFTWSPVQLGAAVAYAACTVLFATANKLTTAANAILLQYTAPIYVALLGAWLLRERATRADWFTIVAALGGMVLFFADDGLDVTHVAGNLIAIGSGLAFAVMTVLMRKQKDGSAVESIILGNVIAFLVGLPFLASAPLPDARGLTALALLGVFQLGCSYWLYARAIKHVTALEAVLIPVLEPILNPVWTFLLIGERPGRWALVGGAVVLSAVTLRALASFRDARHGAAPASAP